MDRPTPRLTRAAALEYRRARSRNGAAAVGTKAHTGRSRHETSNRAGVAPVAAPRPTEDRDKAVSAHGEQTAASLPIVVKVLSGRPLAEERRAQRCQVGRGDAEACRPSGRMRPRDGVAPKVGLGTTLQGNLVSGTSVDTNARITGPEAGACRVITGTEYAGAEQYAELCETSPAPNAPKVGVGSTSRGQRVTGTEVGRSERVTGDEHGSCRSVTGTEYLGAENLSTFCGTTPQPGPAKVAVADTSQGQVISGTAVGRSSKVTGDEAGACTKLTGTEYVSSSLSESLCGTRAPRKVSVMSTAQERTLTGTDVGSESRVTGDEHGACTTVSGMQYVGLEQYQACNRPPVPSPEKVGVMRTWRGQVVSGTNVGRSEQVTGDEYGTCQPISGDEYAGPGQYEQYCDPQDRTASQTRMQSRDVGSSFVPSGTRTDGGAVTGAHRGSGASVSGTPYAGGSRGQAPQFRGRFAQPGSGEAPAEYAPSQASGAFSVRSAAPAMDRSVARITGTAYGGGVRITGPVDRADGLVSGTPQFRYRDNGPASAARRPARAEVVDRYRDNRSEPVAPEPERSEPVKDPRSRFTGEGRETGFAITGAAWRPSEIITGTEGASSRRNPTQRGDGRGAVRAAVPNKQVERAEAPVSRVTGSSGNYPQGSLITYSGGARG